MTRTGRTPSLQPLRTAWAGLQARERRLVLLAGGVVALALLWWLLLAPPLKLLQTAPAERDRLRSQAQIMAQLKQEAETLQAQPTLGHEEAWQALQTATQKHLPDVASLSRSGEQAQLTLDGAPAQALAAWLAAARANARALPSQARLSRANDRAQNGDDSAADAGARWSGSLTVALPP